MTEASHCVNINVKKLLRPLVYSLLFLLISPTTAPCESSRDVEFLLGATPVTVGETESLLPILTTYGMNTLSFTVYADQPVWNGAQLRLPHENPELTEAVRSAKRAGVEVVFIPRLRLDEHNPENAHLWHGMISPGDHKLEEWFAAYSQFMLQWARFADREGIDILALGSELSELTSTQPLVRVPDLHAYFLGMGRESPPGTSARQHREWALATAYARSGSEAPDVDRMNLRRSRLNALWRGLIREVRAVFAGRVTYAANFDQFEEVGFWSDLDVIGINAYFQLRSIERLSTEAQLEQQLRTGWNKALSRISIFRKAMDIRTPVLFTEIGYTQVPGCTIYPWDYKGDRRVESSFDGQKERVAAIQALSHASRGDTAYSFLRGVIYWRFSTDKRSRLIEPYTIVASDPSEQELLRSLSRLKPH